MNTKLTLRLDEEVIGRIKKYAGKEQLSLSKFTEKIFRQILDSSEDNTQHLTPIVKKYKGILKDDIINDREELTDYLMKKHT
ncbi:hypothetical protein HQ585_05350 [candidate division KSB1 bacterium]|nr:hypothetical protein [candidate division KSB1 bacterium]